MTPSSFTVSRSFRKMCSFAVSILSSFAKLQGVKILNLLGDTQFHATPVEGGVKLLKLSNTKHLTKKRVEKLVKLDAPRNCVFFNHSRGFTPCSFNFASPLYKGLRETAPSMPPGCGGN